jgi:beta-carotene 3-hydroxylase
VGPRSLVLVLVHPAASAVVAADGDRGDTKAEVEAAWVATAVRAARKQSEHRTYLVAVVMSSLGITSMADTAVYYRFNCTSHVTSRVDS